MLKKNSAIIYVCSCDEYAFQTAISIMSFEKHSKNSIDNYIIFCDKYKLTQKKRDNILAVCSDKIIFRDFTREHISSVMKIDKKMEERFSYIIYAFPYIYDYLEDYKNIVWMDSDMLATQNINPLFGYKLMAWRKGDLLRNAVDYDKGYIGDEYSSPTGCIIFINDELSIYKSDIVIGILNNYFGKYISAPSEFGASMFAFLYNIDVKLLPKSYCAKVNQFDFNNPFIIHAHYAKFHKYSIMSCLIPEWKEYYDKWISISEEDYIIPTLGPANFPIYKHKIFIYAETLEVWASINKYIYRSLPVNVRPSLATYNKILPFYILDKSEKAYFYLHYTWRTSITIGFMYRGRITDEVRHAFKKIVSITGMEFEIVENEQSISCFFNTKYNIQKNAENFLNFVKRSIHIICNCDDII